MTRQRATGKNLQEEIDFGGDLVTPSKSEKMLGVTLETNLSVSSHLLLSDSSVLKQVSRKMRALWLIRRHLSFKSRKMTAWGLVMSKLIYAIEVWGPMATEKQLGQLQVVHNSIMRWICAAGREIRTKDLLRMSGMMSIRQIIMYRVLMTGLIAIWNKSPRQMSQWRDFKARNLHITSKSFRFCFCRMLVILPADLMTKDPRKNKSELKKWIHSNIPWDKKWDGLGDQSSDVSDAEGD